MKRQSVSQMGWGIACVLGLTVVLSAQAPGPGQENRPRMSGMNMPKPGPCPLPILSALPEYSDTTFYAKRDVPHGKVEQATYQNIAGQDKRMHIYLPPDYDKNPDARYPVLYLNHGGGDDDSKWTSEDPRNGGNAHLILDNLIAAGKARPMIIVMPNTRGIASGTPSAPGKDDACTQEYLTKIIPYIEGHYRTKPGRENRTLAGLSMGGFVVMNTGLARLDTFSELYVYSSGYLGDEQVKAFEANFEEMFKDPKTNDLFRVPFYMAAGETDIALRNSQRTLSVINKYGIRNFWVLSSGGHDWANWRRYLYQTAQIMFPESNPAGPAIPAANRPIVTDGTVAGQWKAEFDTQVGKQKYLFEFQASGEKLTGKATGQIEEEKRAPVDIQDGSIKGNDISFVEMLKFNEMELRIEYSGKVQGDEITMTRKVGDTATEEFTARRVGGSAAMPEETK
jgi:enterochelin esterase-like enzyme